MMDDSVDPLVEVSGDLPRLAPSEARSKRIHARCAGLYKAAAEPRPAAPKSGTLVLASLAVMYLFEVTRLCASWFSL